MRVTRCSHKAPLDPKEIRRILITCSVFGSKKEKRFVVYGQLTAKVIVWESGVAGTGLIGVVKSVMSTSKVSVTKALPATAVAKCVPGAVLPILTGAGDGGAGNDGVTCVSANDKTSVVPDCQLLPYT